MSKWLWALCLHDWFASDAGVFAAQLWAGCAVVEHLWGVSTQLVSAWCTAHAYLVWQVMCCDVTCCQVAC
jgi:hypothetical protein